MYDTLIHLQHTVPQVIQTYSIATVTVTTRYHDDTPRTRVGPSPLTNQIDAFCNEAGPVPLGQLVLVVVDHPKEPVETPKPTVSQCRRG